MMVSPLSVVSTGRGRRFTSEAVQRLLKEEQESSFVNDVLVLETEEESSDPQSGEGPVETPKQKPDQPLFLTPRPRVEPLDDLRGKLLKTPKQKPEQKDCLTGVKRIMKTPRDTIEPVEDIRGRLLVTPKQKPEPRDCLTGVKEIFDIPQWEDKALEDLQGKLETPDASKAEGMSPVASEMMDMLTPNVKATQMECLTGVKRIMKTPKEKGTPVEDMVGVKRILTTPRQKGEPVEDNFGIKRLVKSPKQRGNATVEDFEGLQQLMEEPLSDRAEAIIVEVKLKAHAQDFNWTFTRVKKIKIVTCLPLLLLTLHLQLEDQAVPNCGVDIPQGKKDYLFCICQGQTVAVLNNNVLLSLQKLQFLIKQARCCLKMLANHLLPKKLFWAPP